MTSTSVHQGLVGDKSSSRVLQPPGGGSSNIFGGPEISSQPKKTSTHQQSSVFGDGEVPVSPKTSAARAGETQDRLFGNKNPQTNPAVKDYNRSNIFEEAATDVNATPKQTGQTSFNPITGQSAEHKVESPTIRPSSRVRQPPGGASSKLW